MVMVMAPSRPLSQKKLMPTVAHAEGGFFGSTTQKQPGGLAKRCFTGDGVRRALIEMLATIGEGP